MIAVMAEVLPVPGGPCTTTQAHTITMFCNDNDDDNSNNKNIKNDAQVACQLSWYMTCATPLMWV